VRVSRLIHTATMPHVSSEYLNVAQLRRANRPQVSGPADSVSRLSQVAGQPSHEKCSFSVYSFLPGSFHERHEALFTQSLIRRVIAKASEFEAI